jgi:hypothetical protein
MRDRANHQVAFLVQMEAISVGIVEIEEYESEEAC